jgi:hypothetical protein
VSMCVCVLSMIMVMIRSGIMYEATRGMRIFSRCVVHIHPRFIKKTTNNNDDDNNNKRVCVCLLPG